MKLPRLRSRAWLAPAFALLGVSLLAVVPEPTIRAATDLRASREEFFRVLKNAAVYQRGNPTSTTIVPGLSVSALGQVFTAPLGFTLTALVLRTGNDRLAFLPGAANAPVFVQFFDTYRDLEFYLEADGATQ